MQIYHQLNFHFILIEISPKPYIYGRQHYLILQTQYNFYQVNIISLPFCVYAVSRVIDFELD